MSPFAPEALRGVTGRLITLGLVHSVWIGLAAAAFAAVTLWLLPHRWRGLRYGFLLTTLVGVAFAPIVVTAMQRWEATARQPAPLVVEIGTTRKNSSQPSSRNVDSPPAPVSIGARQPSVLIRS